MSASSSDRTTWSFGPYGTHWDEGAKAVVFEDGSAVRVGDVFHGAGGEYGTDVDFASLIGAKAGDAISTCLEATHADGVLVATPDGS